MLLLVLAATSPAQTPTAAQIPPPAVPPASLPPHEWNIVGNQETHGHIRIIHGHPAEIEGATELFRADEIEFNEDTGDLRAEGHVYFRSFTRNEQLWCSRLEYNTENETGRYYDVRGETMPRIVARRGVLTGKEPFHFEGEWAERIGEKYILYHGWVTNCTIPDPWWRMKGKRFDIIPEERSITHDAWFFVWKMPIFYAPYFYHSLEKHPRKSGFLIPNLVPHSQRGPMFGIGYYWAINRDYDITYRFQDYTSQALAHHIDIRAKPRAGTSFGAIIYGVQDFGTPGYTGPLNTYSGLNIYAAGVSDVGDGWFARGYLNYTSSFRFRQYWSQSYNDAIGSEIHSSGSLGKNWSTYNFDVIFDRIQNFENSEIPETNPTTGAVHFLTDAVTIHHLPDAELSSRDHQISSSIPLWFSFDSEAGLLDRSFPLFNQNNVEVYNFQTSQAVNRLNLSPHLTSVLHLGDFHLVPSIGLDETFYSQSQTQFAQSQLQSNFPIQNISPTEPINQALNQAILRSARDFTLDLIFPSFGRVFNKKTFLGDKLKHVIEPRATYKYVTGIGSDFNQIVRFDSLDILSDTNELDLSLTNRIYAKRGGTTQEIFSWELLQARYFDPTFGGALISGQANVFATTADITAYAFLVGPRTFSPIASIVRANPIPGTGIQWQADYDPRFGRIVDSDISVDYRWSPKYRVSVGNDELRNDILPAADQYRVRFDYGDANRRGLNAGIEAVYDIQAHVLRYTTSQVTYNTDCCGLSVEYRRYNAGIRDESQFRIAFSLANLGTFGTLRKQDRLF